MHIAYDQAVCARCEYMIFLRHFFIIADSKRSFTIPAEMSRNVMAIIPGDE
jgi:hypothetical protein